ncbi:MAG TPA: hypothetical protein VLX44_18365 [Xanthobacteraceae bacterium]|nr:hypothetical protein [Xanthobacteraceae bacterium]
MHATSFGPAMRLFAALALVAVLTPIGRGPATDLPIGAPQASAQQSGAVVLAQGRCFNGRCVKR